MSTIPDNELDLEKLFLPAWAQEPSSTKQYAQYEGRGEDREERGERRRGRGPGRDGGPRQGTPQRGPRRDRPPGGERGDRGQRGVRGGGGGERRGEGGRGKDFRGERRGGRGDERRERREPPPPLPDISVSLVPDAKGVESLARQIKMTGRAYPLFDIAQMILQKPERHEVAFKVNKNAEGQIAQPLFVCALDDTLWLSEDEAVAHVLKKHFATFYQAERTPTEPPKGRYTFVAQCGMSGAILGPPNYHDYQNQLRKLHAERYSRMPIEVYKSRVKIVRDEEVIKKWVDEQSFKTEYLCLNMPEPLKLATIDAVEKHFREVHKENIIKQVESNTMTGTASRSIQSPDLARLVRSAWEDQRRFPLQIATTLSQQFASHGLQFFKVNRTITHVSVARPHYLDMEATPVSEGVKRIVDYINANPKCTRRKLMEVLAPGPTVLPVATPEAATGDSPKPAPHPEPTAEQTAVVADLHWLIHQGHVIEFANGTLETAKKPLPKPPKPEPKKPEDVAGESAEGAAVSSEPVLENAVAPHPEGEAEQPSASSQGEAQDIPSTAISPISSPAEPPPAESPAAAPAAPSAEPVPAPAESQS